MSYCSESNEEEKCLCEIEREEVRKANDRLITRINVLTINENKLRAELKESKEYNKCVLAKLQSYKAQLEEKSNTVNKLTACLKSKNEEIFNAHKKFNMVYQLMALDCETCKKTEFTGTNNADRSSEVPDKLKTLGKKLCEATVAFKEVSMITESEENRKKNMVEKLKENNHAKQKELSRMTSKIKQLQLDQEHNVSKINKQRNLIQELKCKIENIANKM
ncbi:Hypothetical protein CINCED_3A009868 [Cinara cedri]|uniref:Uncharacterized protein n=1 Tax=Cinara cedri TaxID=506608 RepID=A0A5E4NIX1_9HEMI|nr:Hypothetical protein CINCED_3A009868 [Cinara cedri]